MLSETSEKPLAEGGRLESVKDVLPSINRGKPKDLKTVRWPSEDCLISKSSMASPAVAKFCDKTYRHSKRIGFEGLDTGSRIWIFDLRENQIGHRAIDACRHFSGSPQKTEWRRFDPQELLTTSRAMQRISDDGEILPAEGIEQ